MTKIIEGDAYELIKQLPTASVDLIMTDPPYSFGTRGGGRLAHREIFGEIETAALASGIDYSILDEFLRVLRIPNLYIWCNKAQLLDYLHFFHEKHGLNYEIVIWNKPHPIPFCNGHYLRDKEYCLFFWKTGAHLKGTYHTMRTCYTLSNTSDRKKYGHPTIKPLGLIKTLVENSTKVGDVVLDPFLGSGTTAVACDMLGLSCIGFEKNPKYVEIAKRRINET